MAYRQTERSEARKAALRQKIIDGAMQLVADGGFGALTMNAVAQAAGIATGAVYKHFDSKAQLCTEIFRLATERELAVVRDMAHADGSAQIRLMNAIGAFAARAIRGRRLAYALIAEPVDTMVNAERLRYRQAYAAIFEELVKEGIGTGDFPAQIASVSAAALVGVISEALVGPLTWKDGENTGLDDAELIRSIQTFCARAVALKDIDTLSRTISTD